MYSPTHPEASGYWTYTDLHTRKPRGTGHVVTYTPGSLRVLDMYSSTHPEASGVLDIYSPTHPEASGYWTYTHLHTRKPPGHVLTYTPESLGVLDMYSPTHPEASGYWTCTHQHTRKPRGTGNFMPEYGESNHNSRNRHIHLPDVRCEFGKLNAKYQIHLRLRELAIPSNPPIYPLTDINDDTLSKSLSYFSDYI